MNKKDYLKDLYRLGEIQGEHNINWSDEYNLLEYSKDYYEKTMTIASKYNITCTNSLEDFREYNGEPEYMLWDKFAFKIHSITKEHIESLIDEMI